MHNIVLCRQISVIYVLYMFFFTLFSYILYRYMIQLNRYDSVMCLLY